MALKLIKINSDLQNIKPMKAKLDQIALTIDRLMVKRLHLELTNTEKPISPETLTTLKSFISLLYNRYEDDIELGFVSTCLADYDGLK